MANKSINISLNDTFESMVLKGKIGNKVWTGVIDVESVTDALVEDENVRQRLNNLIEDLEQTILKIRLYQNTAYPGTVDYMRVRELSRSIYEIVASGKVDVELYLITLVKKFDEMKKIDPNEFARINNLCKIQMEQNRKAILSQNAVFAYPVYLAEKKEYSFETELIKEQEGKVRKKGNAEKLLSFIRMVYGEENLPEDLEMDVLDEINDKMLVFDMLEALYSPSVKGLLYDSFLRNYLLRQGLTRMEIDDCDSSQLRDFVEELRADDDGKVFRQVLTDTLLTHIDYISVEKYIVAFLYRSVEDFGRSAQLSYDFEEVFDESRELYTLMKRILGSKILSNVTASVMTSEGMKSISVRDMKKIEKEFVDGIYLTPNILESMKTMLFLNRSNLENCDERIIEKLNCSALDLEVISLVDFSNLKRLFELGKINKTFIDRLVRNCNLDIYKELQKRDDEDEIFKLIQFPSKIELVKFLYENQYITEKDLFEYYSLNELSISDLEEIENIVEDKSVFFEKMKAQIDDFDFLSRYKEYVQAQIEYNNALKANDSNIDMYKRKLDLKRNEKDRLLLLYRKYKSEKTLEKKTEFLDDAMLYYCIENENDVVIESLRVMYKDSIISLEDIEYLDSSYLQVIIMDNLFAKGELNLDDTEKIKNSISADALKNIILNIVRNPDITRSQKFALIMNVYNTGTKEEAEISEELLEELRLVYDGNDIGKTGKSKGPKKVKPVVPVDPSKVKKIKSNVEWVYPKYVKWKFLKALDKDAEVKLYAGGYVEVYSKKLDARIIERYFETDKSGDDFGIDAYGYATFILSDTEYRANQSELVSQRACETVVSGQTRIAIEEYMSREALVRIVDSRDRIRHNTHSQTKNWMREMVKYFKIDLDTDLSLVQDSRYTKEELEALRDVIRTYENAYIDRNAER